MDRQLSRKVNDFKPSSVAQRKMKGGYIAHIYTRAAAAAAAGGGSGDAYISTLFKYARARAPRSSYRSNGTRVSPFLSSFVCLIITAQSRFRASEKSPDVSLGMIYSCRCAITAARFTRGRKRVYARARVDCLQ